MVIFCSVLLLPDKTYTVFLYFFFLIIEQVKSYSDKVSANWREEYIRICVRMNESAFPLPRAQRSSSFSGVITHAWAFLTNVVVVVVVTGLSLPSLLAVVYPVTSFSNSVSNEACTSRQPGPLSKTVYIFLNTQTLCICRVCEELEWASQICSEWLISAADRDWAFPCTPPCVSPVSSSWFKIGLISRYALRCWSREVAWNNVQATPWSRGRLSVL